MVYFLGWWQLELLVPEMSNGSKELFLATASLQEAHGIDVDSSRRCTETYFPSEQKVFTALQNWAKTNSPISSQL